MTILDELQILIRSIGEEQGEIFRIAIYDEFIELEQYKCPIRPANSISDIWDRCEWKFVDMFTTLEKVRNYLLEFHAGVS